MESFCMGEVSKQISIFGFQLFEFRCAALVEFLVLAFSELADRAFNLVHDCAAGREDGG